MEITERIQIAEDRAKDLKVSVAEICRRAGIDRSTWARWKDGSRKDAMISKWDAVEVALAAIAKERKQ